MIPHIRDCVYCVDVAGCENEQADADPKWPAQAVFILTPKAYWDKEQKCDASCTSIEGLPKGFHNAAEAEFHYNGPINDGAAKLQAAGCQYSEGLDRWINEVIHLD